VLPPMPQTSRLPTSPTTNLQVHRYCTSITHFAIRSDEVLLTSAAAVCWCRDERASGSASNGGTGRTGTSPMVRSNAQGGIQFHLNHLVSSRFHLVSSRFHLVSVSLPPRYHLVSFSSPPRYYLVTISFPPRFHLVATGHILYYMLPLPSVHLVPKGRSLHSQRGL